MRVRSSTTSLCGLILMWSHYSDKHSGVCIGFDTAQFEELIFQQVGYEFDFPSVQFRDFYKPTWETFFKTALRKSRHWSFEKEWRTGFTRGVREFPNAVKRVIIRACANAVTRTEAVTALAAMVIVPLDFEGTQQTVDPAATDADAAGIADAGRTDEASFFVAAPFFVARRRPLPGPWLPGQAPGRASQTPFDRTDSNRPYRPATWPPDGVLVQNNAPNARKSVVLRHSTPATSRSVVDITVLLRSGK